MDMDALSQPFGERVIKVRKGNFGQKLRYAEASEYIMRLNSVFEGRWSFEVRSHRVLDGEVVVLGKLTVDNVTKEAFGGSSITLHSQTGVPISIADDLKSACTDSLKKCASLLGVGLYLYSDSNGETQNRRSSESETQGTPAPRRNFSARKNNPPNTPPPTNGQRLSQKQLSAIWSMGRKLGLTADAIRARCLEMFNQQPEYLSKAEASSVIGAFSSEIDKAAA